MNIPIIHWTLEFSLRILGLWPGKPILISQLLVYSSIVVLSPFQLRDICEIYRDTPKMLDGVRNFVAIVFIVIKFAIMRYNQGILHSLLNDIEEDWKNIKNSEDREIMMKYLKYAYKFCICIWCLYTAVTVAYFLECFYSLFQNNRVLVMPATYPFDLSFTPYFTATLLFQSVLYTLWFFANGLSESLLGTLIFHLSARIEILMKEISELSFSDNSLSNKYLITFIKNVVRNHRKLILMCHKIEAIYSYICLTQFIASTIVLCLAGMLIITFEYDGALDIIEMMKNIIFIFLNLAQAFSFCFSGEILLTQSSNIPQCISNCTWYETSPSTIKLLLMVIIRTQKPLVLTVGKFTELSIGSFTKILQTSVSYLSVLRTRY